MDVEARVRDYIKLAIADDIRDDDDMFELGVVNSLFALQLVQFVETEFSLRAERDDLDINNFCSINALAAFVRRKLGHAAD
jgi:methoxymalonate biosynthesis acyl carrier protein